MTGDFYFDEAGHRTYFTLDVVEKQRDNMVKTGIWNPDMGVNFTMTNQEFDSIVVEQLQNKTLRIATALNTPFIIGKSLPDELPEEALERLTFEEKYEGYVIDFVKHLSRELKFKYKMHLVKDGKYGSYNSATGTWNGLIGR